MGALINIELIVIIILCLALSSIIFYNVEGISNITKSKQIDEELNSQYVEQNDTSFQKSPTVKDINLKVEKVFAPLYDSTSMAFLGPNDILVLDKTMGTVNRIVNGSIQDKPILDLPVNFKGGRGMLGIAVDKIDNEGKTYVFLYFTSSSTGKDNQDLNGEASNHLYRYEFNKGALINPKLLLNVTAISPKGDAGHNGGKIVVGPDKNIYLVVGDLREHTTRAQNNQTGAPPDGSSVIYRLSPDGDAVTNNPLGRNNPVNLYYAYGIRNSFGLDFDPVSGKLWDTENGVTYGDEINLVEPGFNSGWKRQQGFMINPDYPDRFVDIGDRGMPGNYSDPEFIWKIAVGPTDLKFLNSDKLGKQYENDLFVADVVNGNIYHFDLDDNRSKLLLKGKLSDKIADNMAELESRIFAGGFGIITDLEVGPDGYLYVLTKQFQTEGGDMWRIIPLVDKSNKIN